MNLFEIEIDSLKELHFTNRHLKLLNKSSIPLNSKVLEAQNNRMFLMNKFELQGKTYLTVLTTYFSINFDTMAIEEHRCIDTTSNLDIFKEYCSDKDIDSLQGETFEKEIERLYNNL